MKILSKHIRNIIEDSIAIEMEEAKKVGALGFMARSLVQATMPHRNLDENEFIRKNGNFTLSILAPSQIGLPYGNIPRLLLAWLTTEAVINQSRVLYLGNTLSSFMSKIDMLPTGGRWGSITRLREQSKRLFSSSVSCYYENSDTAGESGFRIADAHEFWWHPNTANQTSLFDSTVTLSESFFREIIEHPVPIDLRVIKSIKRSPMALDIYCWLTYRMSYLRTQTQIRWEVLQNQFGSNYAQNAQGTRDFKRAFLREARKVSVVYPFANIDQNERGFVLKTSKTHITKQVDNPVS